MNFALGCSFNVKHLAMNFPLKKLTTKAETIIEMYNDTHRRNLVWDVFLTSFVLVVDDIIDNNITFIFPLNGIRACKMKMDRVQGEKFARARRNGKWEEVDILASNFTGYEIGLFMGGRRTPRLKIVYVDPLRKKRITENTNNGMNYGDGKIDKKIKDYYEQIFAKFPKVNQSDIKRILNFMWKSLYLHNSYGGDVILKRPNFWSYCGKLRKSSLYHYSYYIRKLSIKLRVLYKRKRIPWDGYYYFGITEKLLQEILGRLKSRGRKKKYIEFKNVFLYQIFDDCRISDPNKLYIYRIPYITNPWLKHYIPNLRTDKAELVLTRKPLKFRDILVYENEYEFI